MTGRTVAALLAAVVLAAAVLVGCSASSSGGRRFSGHPISGRPAAGTAASIDGVSQPEPGLLVLQVHSPAVGATVPVRLVLPKDYAAKPAARWPVLYLLHGCCDTAASWLDNTDVRQLASRADVLTVLPEGGPVGYYSNWRHGPHWETFHLVELPALLAQHYRASTVRAVAGLSMGGLGALAYAARHRGMFRAAASFSGVVDTRLTPALSAGYRAFIDSRSGTDGALWGDPVTDADVWKAHNPSDLAPKLRGLALFVSSGNGTPGPLDPSGAQFDSNEDTIHVQNVAFVARLRALHIAADVDLYGNGTHSWPYWQRELHRAWPMLLKALRSTSR